MNRRDIINVLVLALVTVTAAQPLTLEQSVNRALEQNLSLKALHMEADMAGLRVKKAYSSFLPQVTLSSAYSKIGLPDWQKVSLPMPVGVDLSTGSIITQDIDASFFPEEQYDTKFQVVLPVFLGGKRFKGISMARLEEQMRTSALDGEKKNTVFQVKEMYYNLLKLDDAVRITEENVQLTRDHLAQAQALFDNGMFTRAQVTGMEVQVAEAEQSLLQMQQQRDMARLAFADLLNMADGAGLTVQMVDGDPREENLSAGDAVENALKNRAELKQLEDLVSISEQSVGMARSGFLPNFNVIYSYGWQDEKLEFKSDTWQFIGSMEWNIFAGGSDYLKVKEAKLALARARTDLEKAKRGFTLQAQQAFLLYTQARAGLNVARERLKASEENYAIVSKSFEQGLVNELTEKDARMGMAGARLTETNARFDLHIAAARLDNAMGIAQWPSSFK